jgi:ATP-dependent exoDNAse (exonuclease V) beta subunit
MSGNPGITAFLDWWDIEGIKKSILMPENQDAIKVLTIHKSKGLEFKIVILPFLSWNLDHNPFHSNILWVVPEIMPFNKLGILPVRYSSELEETIFSRQYSEEKCSVYLDNVNLLYVAFTRAVNSIIAFAPDSLRTEKTIATVVRDAITCVDKYPDGSDPFLFRHFDPQTGIFEFGILDETSQIKDIAAGLKVVSYPVNYNTGYLKLKLHWEDYLNAGRQDIREKLKYGMTMHEIFSEIITVSDVPAAVRKMVIENKIKESEEPEMIQRISDLLSQPVIQEWFREGNRVMNEASILLTDSTIRRPDRIIERDGRFTIVDFKFGEVSKSHLIQVRNYSKLLSDMGYGVEAAYLWYVDTNEIVLT